MIFSHTHKNNRNWLASAYSWWLVLWVPAFTLRPTCKNTTAKRLPDELKEASKQQRSRNHVYKTLEEETRNTLGIFLIVFIAQLKYQLILLNK